MSMHVGKRIHVCDNALYKQEVGSWKFRISDAAGEGGAMVWCWLLGFTGVAHVN